MIVSSVAVSARDVKLLRWTQAGAALFSTCSRRQFMAVIVDTAGRVVGTGYNGAPPGRPHCVDGACPHADDEHGLSSAEGRTCIAVHAEANALLYSDHQARRGGTLYVNGLPCVDCARLILGSGLHRVVCTSAGVGAGVAELIRGGVVVVVAHEL